MANSVVSQILQDGAKWFIIKVDGILDTSDYSSTAIVDPTSGGNVGALTTGALPSKLDIQNIEFDVEDGIEVRLAWDATTPVRIGQFAGRGKRDYKSSGGLWNNAGAGITGKILLSTEGFTANNIYSFTLVLQCTKRT